MPLFVVKNKDKDFIGFIDCRGKLENEKKNFEVDYPLESFSFFPFRQYVKQYILPSIQSLSGKFLVDYKKKKELQTAYKDYRNSAKIVGLRAIINAFDRSPLRPGGLKKLGENKNVFTLPGEYVGRL